MNNKTSVSVIAILLAALVIVASLSMFYYLQYTQARNSSDHYLSQLDALGASYNATVSKYNSLAQRYDSLGGSYNGSLGSLSLMIATYNGTVRQFNSLASTYEELSQQYNSTISLLARSVAVLNTSEPVYQNASKDMTAIWADYSQLTTEYRNELAAFNSTYSALRGALSTYEKLSNQSNVQIEQPVGPMRVPLYTADILVTFGNGTRTWYNDTSFQPGWNLFVTTLALAHGQVQATWYPAFGEHLVTGIEGGQSTSTTSWFVWVRNETSWTQSPLGSDLVQVTNGTTYAWTLCGYDSSFDPTCTPSQQKEK